MPNRFKILFLSFSMSACATVTPGPLVDVCISNPSELGFDCINKAQVGYFLPYSESENYTSLPPDDFEALLNYCKNK